MPIKEPYRLCGGTFFVLVLNARKPMPSKDELYKGNASGLSEPEALLALTKALIPDIPQPMSTEMKSLKDNTRDFKACIRNGGTFYRLGDTAVLKNFDECVKNQYEVPLAAMVKFVEDFLDVRTSTKKDEYLIKGLVEMLDADTTIDGNEVFYVCQNGGTMTKNQILMSNHFCVPAFLLGLWHYALTVVRDNTVGQSTYDEFCPKRGGAERVYTKTLGEDSVRDIKLTYCDLTDFDSDQNSEPEVEKTDDCIEPEIDNHGKSQEQTTATGAVVNNNPFFLNISGGTNTVYGHVDKVEINNGRSDADER